MSTKNDRIAALEATVDRCLERVDRCVGLVERALRVAEGSLGELQTIRREEADVEIESADSKGDGCPDELDDPAFDGRYTVIVINSDGWLVGRYRIGVEDEIEALYAAASIARAGEKATA